MAAYTGPTLSISVSRKRDGVHVDQNVQLESIDASTMQFRGRFLFPIFVVLVLSLAILTFCEFILLICLYILGLISGTATGAVVGLLLLFIISAMLGRASPHLGFYVMICGLLCFLIYAQDFWLQVWVALADIEVAMDMLFVYMVFKIMLTILIMHMPK